MSIYEFSFCPYCGTKLDGNEKFCKNCGKQIVSNSSKTTCEEKNANIKNPTERKTVFEGEIHKCPSCGEVLNSFLQKCPACDYEIRGCAATTSLKDFLNDLKKASNVEEKDCLIRNFPIPNTKEDIIEFMILATSNVQGEDNKDILEAWIAKIEQAYSKSNVILKNDPTLSQTEELYEKSKKQISVQKMSNTTSFVGNSITRYFKFMKSPVFAIVFALLVFYNIIRIIRFEFAGIDIIFDAIILGITYKFTNKRNKDK